MRSTVAENQHIRVALSPKVNETAWFSICEKVGVSSSEKNWKCCDELKYWWYDDYPITWLIHHLSDNVM